MALPELENFNLAGGTALALYYGHRVSVYLDLFPQQTFRPKIYYQFLKRTFPISVIANRGTINISGEKKI
jgi:hypothetical protein